MHGHRSNAQLLARPQHAQCDFAAIGYQDLVEHLFPKAVRGGRQRRKISLIVRYSMTTRGSPNSTGCPSSTRICVTVPARGDGIWFIVFIASMINSVCPTDTLTPTTMNGLAPGSEAQ